MMKFKNQCGHQHIAHRDGALKQFTFVAAAKSGKSLSERESALNFMHMGAER